MEIEEIKRICNNVVQLENKRYNLNINLFPVTVIEYYNQYILKEKMSLIKKAINLNIAFIPDVAGFNDHNNNIVIFIKNLLKKKTKDPLLYTLETCYHEVRHTLQDEMSFPKYHIFIKNIENELRNIKTESYYMFNHDKFSTEIDANIYGVNNAISYIKNNYPMIYEKNKNKYEKHKKKYYFDYYMYDSTELLDFYLKNCKENTICSVIKNKNFSDLLCDLEFNKLDKKIRYIILSSDHVLRTASLNNLDEEQLILLNKIFDSSLNKYNEQLNVLENYYKEKLIKEKTYLKEKKKILKKIDSKNEIYYNIMNSKNINIR